jgi:hypothetical protein
MTELEERGDELQLCASDYLTAKGQSIAGTAAIAVFRRARADSQYL